ncbi:MAG: alpha amylase C-terminal domain-containing protein, partial [Caldilineaceae bacterium]|nr:alpha amylase C-terminal domain-containing protein [Caldilineaceae bacterium]
EFGQGHEWSEVRSLDWHLLQYDEHRHLKEYMATLNHLYLSEPALSENDLNWDGFMWIDLSDADQSVISFARRAANPDNLLVFVCNFTPVPRLSYRVGLPKNGRYTEVLNSDWSRFGGSGIVNDGILVAEEWPWQNCDYSVALNLPPLGVTILKPEGFA